MKKMLILLMLTCLLPDSFPQEIFTFTGNRLTLENGFVRRVINITNDGFGHFYSHTANGPSVYLWSGATNGTSPNEAYYIESRRKEGRSKTASE